MEETQKFITIPYNEEMKQNIPLDSNKIEKINTQFSNGTIPIKTFVEMAELKNVVASVSSPSDKSSQPSITEIKMDEKQIYPPSKQEGGSKRRGGRKSRVSTRRGGGRKSRRRHNYI
jgi:hypothetical protein